jgi:hypothetical protein
MALAAFYCCVHFQRVEYFVFFMIDFLLVFRTRLSLGWRIFFCLARSLPRTGFCRCGEVKAPLPARRGQKPEG